MEIKEEDNRIIITSNLFYNNGIKINVLFYSKDLNIVLKRLEGGNKYPFNGLIKIKSHLDTLELIGNLREELIKKLKEKFNI